MSLPDTMPARGPRCTLHFADPFSAACEHAVGERIMTKKPAGKARKTAATVALLVSLLVIVGFVVMLINQTAQLVDLSARLAPWLGQVVLWSLVTLYAFCIVTPLYLLLSLPKPLRAPSSESDPAFPEHLERLAARLGRNPHLPGRAFAGREEVEAGLVELDALANERTRQAASQVFITTAVSQNGSLDTFLVLAAQSKLVLEIARTYYQRPTLRDLAYLYSNVAATAFIAGELEDLDITEQIQPILAAVFGSAAGAIPGFGAATTLFMNSVTTGSANAFLTLRVGVITKHYCRSVVLPPKRVIRRTALTEATQMLGGIAMTGTRRVAVALGAATTSSIGGAFESFGDQIRAAGSGIKGMSSAAVDKLRFRRPGPGPEPSGAPDG